MTSQPPLFSPAYQQPVDTSTQVDRMPGTADADCLCPPKACSECDGWLTHESWCPIRDRQCVWPFCTPPKEDE